jgi:predicted RNase H-like HicB family nuclease
MGSATARRELVQTFETEEDQGFHVHVPALKGCHSWGATRAEARAHIKEAIELWLESAKELGIQVPNKLPGLTTQEFLELL